MRTTELSRSGSALTLLLRRGRLGAFTSLGLASCRYAAFATQGGYLPKAGMTFLERLDFQSLTPRPQVTYTYV
jgi:hypothetical protein